jgi:hypothetical protein
MFQQGVPIYYNHPALKELCQDVLYKQRTYINAHLGIMPEFSDGIPLDAIAFCATAVSLVTSIKFSCAPSNHPDHSYTPLSKK